MGFFDWLTKKKPVEVKQTTAEKTSYVQGYEQNREFVNWNTNVRNDYILPFDEYLKIYRNHATVYSVIKFICDSIFCEGYQFTAKVDNPSELQLKQLENDIIPYVDPQGNFTFKEILYSSVVDCMRDGMKMIQIDKGGFPYLYDTLETATLRPRLLPNGLFKEDDHGQWEQIIDGTVKARFDNKDLIWLKLPDRTDLIFPQSPLMPLLMDIESDLIAKEFNRQRFENNAYVGLVIQLGEDATKDDAVNMLEFIRDKYKSEKYDFGRTVNRAYKPLILYGGSTIDSGIIDSYKDMDFVKLREITDKEVCRVYGVPYRMLLDEQSGLGQAGASAETANRFFQTVIYPLQNMFAEQIQKQYFEMRLGVTDWKFEFIRPKFIDMNEEVKNHVFLVKNGIMLPIEARDSLREMIPELLVENDEQSIVREEEISEVETESEEMEENEEIKKSCCGDYRIKAKIKDKPRLKEFNVKMVKNDMETTEADMLEGIDKTMLKMKDKAIKDMNKLVTAKDLKGISNYKLPYKNEINNTLKNTGKNAFNDGRKYIRRELKGKAKAEVNLGDYERFVTLQAEIAGDKITMVVEQKLKEAVALAMANGAMSDRDIRGVIEDLFVKEMAQNTVKSRTMTTNFYNLGVDRQIQEVKDFVPKVQYQSVIDDRTTERCTELDGVIVSVDSDLYSKIRPPLHYQCRSTFVPVTIEDIEFEPETFGKNTPRKDIENVLLNTPGFDER